MCARGDRVVWQRIRARGRKCYGPQTIPYIQRQITCGVAESIVAVLSSAGVSQSSYRVQFAVASLHRVGKWHGLDSGGGGGRCLRGWKDKVAVDSRIV